MKHLIEEFISSNLFTKDVYEFYAKVTGRVLWVQGEWISSFQCQPPTQSKGHSAQIFPGDYSALEQYFLGEVSVSIDWLLIIFLVILPLLFSYVLFFVCLESPRNIIYLIILL